jgi:ethanolamine utilization microcompartment shell protein EutS
MVHRCLKELRTLQEAAAKTEALPPSRFEETVEEIEYQWPAADDTTDPPEEATAEKVAQPESAASFPPCTCTPTLAAAASPDIAAEKTVTATGFLDDRKTGSGTVSSEGAVTPVEPKMQNEPTADANAVLDDDCDEDYPGGKVYSIAHRHYPGRL